MGKVYILTNKLMGDDVVKIGRTERSVSDRIREISSGSSPKGWEEYFTVESAKYKEIEKHVHEVFAEKRVWPDREYFSIDKERAVMILKSALSLCGGKESLPEPPAIVEDGAPKLLNKKGSILPLTAYATVGSELVFTRDTSIKCRIIDERHVEYEGSPYSLSDLAGKLVVDKLGYKHGSVAGTTYFMYDNRILSEIRDEIYAKSEE